MSSPVTTKGERVVLTIAAIIMFFGYVAAMMGVVALVAFAIAFGAKLGWSVW